jgi:hypothetical protein
MSPVYTPNNTVGPAGAVDGHVAVFEGPSGRRLKDGGAMPVIIPAAPSTPSITLLDVYPVGSIYLSVSPTSPATLFGGTWVSFGAGRVLVGLDEKDSEFDTAEETGGAKTVQASAQAFSGNVLANHQHAAKTAGTPVGTIGTISATATAASKVGTSTANVAANAHTHPAPTFTGAAMAAHQHDAISAGTPSGTNTPGAATSVIQPYVVCYMFKRTA